MVVDRLHDVLEVHVQHNRHVNIGGDGFYLNLKMLTLCQLMTIRAQKTPAIVISVPKILPSFSNQCPKRFDLWILIYIIFDIYLNLRVSKYVFRTWVFSNNVLCLTCVSKWNLIWGTNIVFICARIAKTCIWWHIQQILILISGRCDHYT